MYFTSHASRTALLASAFVACAAAVAIPSDYEFHRQVPRQTAAGYATSFIICRDTDFNGGCNYVPILSDACANVPPDWSKVVSSVRTMAEFECYGFSEVDCRGGVIGPIPDTGKYRNLADNGFDNQIASGKCFPVAK
ncbi:hypothetical protein HYFRA_00010933 [Hymenoscyphus fraxineus]|uniref:Ecp2 effector protein domain-containing protein n=1 Tax=Hymenoscyphus fraxineus TaxID=746836 RepID=A0A9N9KZN6_9HELO|nr:hypothetical protein HYFRA_00010933 [Hymenoscyphus fraxineus]